MFLTGTGKGPSLCLNSDTQGSWAERRAASSSLLEERQGKRAPLGNAVKDPGETGEGSWQLGAETAGGQPRAPFIKKIMVHSLHLE